MNLRGNGLDALGIGAVLQRAHEGLAGELQQMRVQLLSSNNSEPFFASNQVTGSALAVGTGKPEFIDLGGGIFGGGGGEPLIAQPGSADLGIGLTGKWDFQLWRNEGGVTTGAHVSVSGLNGLIVGDKCFVSAQALIPGIDLIRRHGASLARMRRPVWPSCRPPRRVSHNSRNDHRAGHHAEQRGGR